MSSTQSKRYYKRSSGQKCAYDKQQMSYQPSVKSRKLHKSKNPTNKRKLRRLERKVERQRVKKQASIKAAINEHSIYHDHQNSAAMNNFSRAYQEAILKQKETKNESTD